ncbi:hypothetical protein G4228_013713 [Cervus hanglu yarkandensis]|nr:hypothetical protein G4228_013713 [Cervus hanglu yarkandensis]
MFHGTIIEELTNHREWSHYNENIIEGQKDFVFVKFSGLHLKSMESLQSYISLRVCIFSNNFITDIRPLQSCMKLIKLDLHGNQSIYSPVDLKYSTEQRKLVSSILHELKTRKPRYLIQKGQKESEDETEDEELDVSFRISVLKLPIHTLDSLRYAALLRAKEQDYFPTYAQPFSPAHQKPVVKIKDMLMEKRIRREFLATHRAGMKLQALCDVDKYFSEQKKQESSKNKVTAVGMAKKAQERIRITIRENLNNKIYAAHKLTARDDEIIQDGLQQLYQDRSSYLQKVKERRAQFLEEKKQKAKDRLLIQNLNNECTLLTRGMTAIDRLKSKQAALKEKSLIVQQKLATEKYQRDLLKQMKEIRAQEIHKRHCEEKFVNEMIAYQKACERLQDARTKAAIVKKNLVTKFLME